MKSKLFLANWKMSLTPTPALALAEAYSKKVVPGKDQEVCIFPSVSALSQISKTIAKTSIKLGAQDVFWQEQGAYTGQESILTLKELGCSSVIVGHSERREYYHETDEMVNKKVLICLEQGTRPIICVGESFEQRKNGQKDNVVMDQLDKALAGVKLLKTDQLVVAYEPVWVIGSGQAVPADEAWYTLQVLQQVLLNHFSADVVAKQIWLVYGGSVNPTNIAGFFKDKILEGVLTGGVSLSADEFSQLLK